MVSVSPMRLVGAVAVLPPLPRQEHRLQVRPRHTLLYVPPRGLCMNCMRKYDAFLAEVYWNPVTAASFTWKHEHIIDTSNWKQEKYNETKTKASRLYQNKVKYLGGQIRSAALADAIKFKSIMKGIGMNLTSQINYYFITSNNIMKLVG